MERKTVILLVEDELNLGATLKERLEIEGFQVFWSKSVSDAKAVVASQPVDLALLDVGLPDGNGFDLAAKLKELQPRAALIFLTAFNSPEDRVRGLELGAEDYVTKPFHAKELMLRVQNGLKRARFAAPEALASEPVPMGRARVYFSKFLIEVDGERSALTHKECALLRLLYERRGRVVSRDEILNFVWSSGEDPSPRTIDNFVSKLRKWIEEDPERPKWIKSVRGVGYQLTEGDA